MKDTHRESPVRHTHNTDMSVSRGMEKGRQWLCSDVKPELCLEEAKHWAEKKDSLGGTDIGPGTHFISISLSLLFGLSY